MNAIKDVSNQKTNRSNLLDTELTKKLTLFREQQFSGSLTITSSKGYIWKIYSCLGRLTWADGGIHPNRSWRRNLIKYCPEIKQQHRNIDPANQWDSMTYQLLAIYLQEKTIAREAAIEIIKSKIQEVLFDIFQQEAYQNLSYRASSVKTSQLLAAMLRKPIALINSEQSIQDSHNLWSAWVQKGLGFWSPNLAPKIIQPEALARAVPQKSYQNLVRLLDGKKNLRDIAYLTNQNLFKLANYFVPFLHQGILEFTEIKDIGGPVKYISANKNSKIASKKVNPNTPLIISIDDREAMSKLLGRIIEKAGYRFLGINDNLNAVARVMEENPHLIFLDIDMPIINGYEICSQIRRVDEFKDVPIVMLTGHNGIIDRARAKMVGATGFMTKPIELQDVIGAVKKYVEEKQSD